MERRQRREVTPEAQARRPEGVAGREEAADGREQELDIREGVLDRWERELIERASDLGLLDDERQVSIEGARHRRAEAHRGRRAAAEARHEAAVARGIEQAGARPPDPPALPAVLEAEGQRALRRLAELIEGGGRLRDTLELVLGTGLDAADGPAAVTVSLVVDGRLEPVAGTAAWASELDAVQLRAGTGPLIAASERGSVVVSADLAADPRWSIPWSAGGDDGHRGVVSVPIAAAGGTSGVLTVYGERDAPVDRGFVATAVMVAVQASLAVGWSVQRLSHEAQAAAWERAVASRDEIGQAKGILMAQEGLTDSAAFALLRTTSQAQNTKVRDVAHHVVTHRRLPDPPAG